MRWGRPWTMSRLHAARWADWPRRTIARPTRFGRTAACSTQRRFQVGHCRHQGHRLERRGGQTEAHVESLRLFRDRMHGQAADADTVGRVDDPVRGVLKEGAPQSATLTIACDRKPREHHHGDRVRHVASEAPGGRVGSHGAGRQRVVRNDLACVRCPAARSRTRIPRGGIAPQALGGRHIANDEGAGDTADLVLQRPPPQPVVERWQRRRRARRVRAPRSAARGPGPSTHDQAFDQGVFACMVRRRRSLGRGGASSMARNFE